jgi:bifunctional DNase/RNase
MADGLVEMFVESVRLHMLSNRHVVILKEPDRERYLPIWIGSWEASAIAMRLQGLTPERPLTHDLFAAALKEIGVRVDRVIISNLAEETFHARLIFERDGREMELDARPSDALALAVRTDAAIFAVEEVLTRAALGADSAMLQGEDASTVVESSGASPADPRLDVFRDFINSLDLDLGGGGGGGSQAAE